LSLFFYLVVEGDKDETSKDYIFLLMECLRLVIENDQTNAILFRQHGGSKYTHILIPYSESRTFALKIIEQLIVDGGHDDLGNTAYW
jgi:hypothetical protein